MPWRIDTVLRPKTSEVSWFAPTRAGSPMAAEIPLGNEFSGESTRKLIYDLSACNNDVIEKTDSYYDSEGVYENSAY